jgi:hypothetical protein
MPTDLIDPTLPLPEPAQGYAAPLAAERAVRNVMARYMKLCDQPCHDASFPQLADLFCEDAVWEGIGTSYTQTFGRQAGRGAILTLLARYLAPTSTHFELNVHFLTSDFVTVGDACAHGEWVMLQASTYEDGTSELISARLTVDFRLEEGAWRIAHFRTQRLFCVPWQPAFAAALGATMAAQKQGD